MAAHTSSHEEALRALMIGEIESDADVVRRQLRQCPTCRARLDDFEMIHQAFAETREDAADLQEVESKIDGAHEDLIVDGFRKSMEEQSSPLASESPRRSRMRIAWVLAIASAAAVLLMTLFMDDDDSGTTLPKDLGPEVIRCLSPVDGVESYGDFLWESEEILGVTFELKIFDVEDDANPIIERVLLETEWKPTKDERALLPAKIRWEVRVLNSLPEELGFHRVEAWLSRH